MYSHDSGRALFNRGLHSGSHVQQPGLLHIKDKAEDVSWGEMEREKNLDGMSRREGQKLLVYSIKEQVGFVTILFGFIVALIGVFWMFGDYLGAQLAGSFLLLIGGLTALSG